MPERTCDTSVAAIVVRSSAGEATKKAMRLRSTWALASTSPMCATKAPTAMTIAIVALLFSFWFVFGSGQQATFYAYLLILAGYIVLMGLYVKRKNAGGVVQGDASVAPAGEPG